MAEIEQPAVDVPICNNYSTTCKLALEKESHVTSITSRAMDLFFPVQMQSKHPTARRATALSVSRGVGLRGMAMSWGLSAVFAYPKIIAKIS